MAGFSPRACIPFKGTPAQGRPPLASPRVNTHTPRRAPFLSARQPWSRSSTSLEHPRSDSLPSPHALGGESRVEMGWKHWRGARGAAAGRVEKANRGHTGGAQSRRGRSRSHPHHAPPAGVETGWAAPTRVFLWGSRGQLVSRNWSPERRLRPPPSKNPTHRIQAAADWLRGAASQPPRLRGGSRAVRGGRRTHRLLRAPGAPPE